MGRLRQDDLKALIRTPGRHGDGDGLYFRALGRDHLAYWTYRYRHGGKERKLSIGPYPEVSLIEARAERAALRARVLKGDDPLAEKRAPKQPAQAPLFATPTFGECATPTSPRTRHRGAIPSTATNGA